MHASEEHTVSTELHKLFPVDHLLHPHMVWVRMLSPSPLKDIAICALNKHK